MASNTEEESYVRLSLLLAGISPRAVRTLFDKEFTPKVLPKTIRKEHRKLSDLLTKKIINQKQFDLLIKNPDSKHFDVSLMICLLTNLTSIYGYNKSGLPPKSNKSPSADLARVKHYRNWQSHPSDCKIDKVDFNTAWNDLTGVICRLGGPAMEEECTNLRVKILDQSNRKVMLEIKQAIDEIKSLKEAVDTLRQSNSILQEEVKRRKTAHETLESNCDALKTDNVKKSSKIDELEKARWDTVQWNIREQINEKLDEWKQHDKMFSKPEVPDTFQKVLEGRRV